MHEPDFRRLHEGLLRQGIAPARARRVSQEMREHYEDLLDEYRARGATPEAAARDATRALGQVDDLVAVMGARRELKSWPSRYPRLAVVVYPLACLAVLPATPVIAGIVHAPAVARWGASLIAAGVVTALLLLVLQLSILLG